MDSRFAQPLPEFYKRRIIFWCDEEREFEDKFADLISNWMDEMGIPQTAVLRRQVKEYRKFFRHLSTGIGL